MSLAGSIFNLLRFNKKNWKAVVLCLMAATVFWFFNALNKTYTTILSFPIEFQYDQENFVPVSTLPGEVKMNITGMGWTLLRRSAGVKVPALLYPLERPTETKKLVGSTLPGVFAQQLPDLQINFVVTDTLRLDIEPLDGRWLSVSLSNLDNTFRKGFGLASYISLTPDSVFVQGPRRIVESLPEPYSLPYNKKNLDENQDTQIDIFFDEPSIQVEPQQIALSFQVSKLDEIKDSLSVEFINMPKKLRPFMNVRYIHFTLQLPEGQQHTNYTRESLKATVDFSKVPGGKSRLAPVITGIPPFSKIVQVDTVEVTY